MDPRLVEREWLAYKTAIIDEVDPDHAKRASVLRALADEEDAKQAAKEAKDALVQRTLDDAKLAEATCQLLIDIRKLVNGESVHVAAQAQAIYADLRKQLSPLAASYGYKFVLVGDKTKAALTVL